MGAAPDVVRPLAFDGSTAAGACVATPAGGPCEYRFTDTAFSVLDAQGVLRLNGTMTWQATSPASTTLTLYVPRVVDGEYVWGPGDPAASGTSPLAFDLDLSAFGNETAGLIVGNGVVAPAPGGYAALQVPQAFRLEATLTSRA